MKKLKIFAVIVFMICTITALFGFTSCESYALATPVNVSVDLDNVLTWDEVDQARRYEVEIKNENGEIISSKRQNKAAVSLKDLEIGNYIIRVRALGSEEEELSDWSEEIEFYRAYETGCVYTLINNMEYQITKGNNTVGRIVIEDFYRGKPVTSIADNAFKGNQRITEVVLGNNIKTIGNNAFYKCESLKSIVIPESVTSIGERAFQRCILLEEVVIPNGVTSINDSTFTLCKALKKVTIGANVQYIAQAAFSDCSSLVEVTIPDSVKSIAEDAFSGCTGMEALKIGKGVQTIGNTAFQMCKSLKTLTFAQDSELLYIGQRAFSENESLESIVLPSKLVQLDAESFAQCTKLQSIDLPDSLMRLGAQAFNGTEAFNKGRDESTQLVYVDKWLISADSSLMKTIKAISASEMENYTAQETLLIRGDTVGIAGNTFVSFQELERVNLPESVRAIGTFAFGACPKLFRVDLKETELIDSYSFYGSPLLKNFYPGNSLVEIGDYAFYGCTGLTNFQMPAKDTVRVIGTYAFKKTGIWMAAAENPEGDGLVYVGKWLVGAADEGIVNASLKSGTIGVADYAFFNCNYLGSVNLTGVKYLGRAAFYRCASLSTVQFDANLTAINDYTFYECGRLSMIPNGFPRALKSIGRSAFYNCINLGEADLGKTDVTSIGPYAFFNCSALKKLNLGDSLVSVEGYAFYKCTALENVVIPDTTQAIGERSFYRNTKLKTIDFGEGLVSIGNYAFASCDALTEINLPDSVKYIYNNAFYKCTGVESIDFGNGLIWVGPYAFYGMSGVDSLQLPSSLQVIDGYAFKGWNGLSSVVLSANIQSISQHVFYGCNGMTIYAESTEAEVEWSDKFNSNYRPVIWGCTLSEDKTYVVSVTITENTISNKNAKEGIAAPEREGYAFVGWATQANGAPAYSAADIHKATIGTTLYAVWVEAAPETEVAES